MHQWARQTDRQTDISITVCTAPSRERSNKRNSQKTTQYKQTERWTEINIKTTVIQHDRPNATRKITVTNKTTQLNDENPLIRTLYIDTHWSVYERLLKSFCLSCVSYVWQLSLHKYNDDDDDMQSWIFQRVEGGNRDPRRYGWYPTGNLKIS